MRGGALAVVAIVACGGGAGSGGRDAAPGDGSPPIDAAPPVASCTVPAAGALVDTSASTNVVGTGSAASCTEAALRAAVAAGGQVRFACGAAPVTITLTSALVINNVAGADKLGDIVIDGGSAVTLSGGGTTRIITLDACAAPFNNAHCDTFPHPALTLERIVLTDGADSGSDGGGAVLRRGGALTVIDSELANNHCATTGQDTAGGALRLLQATPALIVGTSIHDNACSNGGGIGSLQASPVTIVNSTIANNTATGNGGNPGNGGNAGGIYHDGTHLALSLCGVQVTGNHGNAFGGGLFFVDDAGSGTVDIADSELSNNDIPTGSGKPSHGGGAYLQGAEITLSNVTVANDAAGFAAGLYVNAMSGHGSLAATNVTISDIAGTALTVEGGVGGTLRACTIAGATRGLSGAGKLAMSTSLVASATGCDAPPIDRGGNFQFPGASCGSAIATADPQLGALADHGGTTHVRTRAPAAGSPAIGAGSDCPAIDARGLPRPATGCTSGAHESADP